MNSHDTFSACCGFEPGRLFPPVDDASVLLLMCRPDAYSASEICRAVEDCDAHVINLNIAADRTLDDRLVVYLRINRRSADSVIRSIERFGYEVVPIDTAREDNDDFERARERAAEILRILDL